MRLLCKVVDYHLHISIVAPKPKSSKRPAREHGGAPGGNKVDPRGGAGGKMERGIKAAPRGGPGSGPGSGKPDPRGGPSGKVDQRSGPGGPKPEPRGPKTGPVSVKPDSRGPGGLRGSKEGRHAPDTNRQPPSVQTKAKDPLKLSGQKPNIKLTLLNKVFKFTSFVYW